MKHELPRRLNEGELRTRDRFGYVINDLIDFLEYCFPQRKGKHCGLCILVDDCWLAKDPANCYTICEKFKPIKDKPTTTEQPDNQCDGCLQGLPIKDGIHMKGNHPDMCCTKDLYEHKEQPERSCIPCNSCDHQNIAGNPREQDTKCHFCIANGYQMWSANNPKEQTEIDNCFNCGDKYCETVKQKHTIKPLCWKPIIKEQPKEQQECPKDKCRKWNRESPNDCYANCARNPFGRDKAKDLYIPWEQPKAEWEKLLDEAREYYKHYWDEAHNWTGLKDNYESACNSMKERIKELKETITELEGRIDCEEDINKELEDKIEELEKWGGNGIENLNKNIFEQDKEIKRLRDGISTIYYSHFSGMYNNNSTEYNYKKLSESLSDLLKKEDL